MCYVLGFPPIIRSDMYDPLDVLRISLLPKIGPSRGRALLAAFGSYAALRSAGMDAIQGVKGFDTILAHALRTVFGNPKAIDDIERSVERNLALCERHDLRLLTFEDASYPLLLGRIYDAPLFLFLRGTLSEEDIRAVAVVGTRAPSEYGRHAAETIVAALAEQGVCVVSGLAVGIDTVVHRTALAQRTRTIAVLGSGVANIYPPSNIELALRVSECGCLISELPVDAKPDAVNFPRRNRIISGLSTATVLVESGSKGGAVLTAKFALDQQREVFAVPGSIFSKQAEGAHHLIRKGAAHLLSRPSDIFDECPSLLGMAGLKTPVPLQLSIDEAIVFDAIADEPVHIDELALATGIPSQELLVLLLRLEFRAVIRQLPGKHFIRA